MEENKELAVATNENYQIIGFDGLGGNTNTKTEVITNITAPPIPTAVFTFFDTPRKGHKPKNWLSTTLLTNEELIKRAAIITTNENLLTMRSRLSSSNLMLISPFSSLWTEFASRGNNDLIMFL